LADVIAGAYGFAINNPRDEYTRRLLDYGPEIIGPGSIWPEREKLDLSTFEGMRNVIVLQELVERSRRKIDLLDGIGEFLVSIEQDLREEMSGKIVGQNDVARLLERGKT